MTIITAGRRAAPATTFKIPEFYMPYPARCNPRVESTRVHVKNWANQMGMLRARSGAPDDDVWDEAGFDGADFGLVAARMYPDASAPELDLLADWYVWAWFYDDFYTSIFTYKNDPAKDKERVSRLAEYMPIEATAVPAPTNPVETGLADLWARTIPTTSMDWRIRFLDIVKGYLYNTAQQTDARLDLSQNPITYVTDVRRKAGGMEFAACLVEYARGVEISSEIASSRPIRVLRETFADSVTLRNDIISYPKELLAGEVNGVMITERFLDCDLQRAVDVVNELATSRMQQFENTTIVELPFLFGDYHLSPKEYLDILSYVKGLQDWMAGELQWEKETARYKAPESSRGTGPSGDTGLPGSLGSARRLARPTGIGTASARLIISGTGSHPAVTEDNTSNENLSRFLGPTGLGTAAARLGLTRRAASVAWPTTSPIIGGEDNPEVELPDFYMPFRAACNPHVDIGRAQSKAWAIEMGMLESGLADWDDEATFDAQDSALLAALMYPDAPGPEYELSALWFTWARFFGDFSDQIFQHRRDLVGAKAAFNRLPAFMPISLAETVPAPINQVERGLADLWPRTAPVMSEDWRRRFTGAFMRTCHGLLWEILNLAENRIPDPVDYIEMRRFTSGAEIPAVLMHYAKSLEIPAEIYEAEPLRWLREAYIDWSTLVNDAFSYKREQKEGDFHNNVLILQRFLDCDLEQAAALVNKLATSRLRDFEHITTAGLSTLADEFSLDMAGREKIARYAQGLQNFVGGHFQHGLVVASGRYGLSTASRAVPGPDTSPTPVANRLRSGPIGLGTGAGRISSIHATGAPAPVGLAVPALGRLPLGPTGIGTAAARIGPACDVGELTTHVSALPSGGHRDIPRARVRDTLGSDERRGTGIGSGPGS